MDPYAYPRHWEADVVLADGGTAHVRPIKPSDAARLRSFYSRLSDESIYFRFFGPRPRLSDKEVAWFTNVDYVRRVVCEDALGIVDPGEHRLHARDLVLDLGGAAVGLA